jgi:hypothetical protein
MLLSRYGDCCLLFGNGECDDFLLPPFVSTGASRPAVGFGSSINFEEAVKVLVVIKSSRVAVTLW